MNSTRFELGNWEADAYAVTARRDTPPARPPRRASPRYSRRATAAGTIGGVHQRHNKRSGL